MGKTAIVSLHILGDALSGQKAARDTAAAVGKMASDVEKSSAAAGEAGQRGFAGIAQGAQVAEAKLGGVYTWATRLIATLTVLGGLSLGAALGTGMQRFVAVENAQASLSVILQDGAKARVLLDQIKEVVNGTPFNFDQFATAGKNLAAMGVDAAKIPATLRAIGEAAAASGKGAEGVQMVSDAFGKMAAQGQVSLDQVWSISGAGVNALAILGNHFGKTTEDMKKMISSGAVPAQEAIDALTAGIMNGSDGIAGKTVALSGTMAGLRDTMEGAWGGMQASLARFGEAIITAAAPAIKDLLQGTTDFVNVLTAAAGPALQQVGQFFADWGPLLGPITTAVITFTAVFLTWVKVVAAIQAVQSAMAALNAVMLANPIALVVASIAALVAGLVWAYTNVQEFRDAVDAMGRWVMGVFDTIGRAIRGMIGWLKDAIGWLGQLSGASNNASAAAAREAAPAAAGTRVKRMADPTAYLAYSAEPAFNLAPTPGRSFLPRISGGRPSSGGQVTTITNNFTVEAAYDRAGVAETIRALLDDRERTYGRPTTAGGALR